MRRLLLLICFLLSVPAFAHKQADANIIDDAYVTVEQMPVFQGNMQQYIKKNLHYPKGQEKFGTEGNNDVKFIVNEDGSLSNIQVIRSMGMDFDNESIRLVKNMPRWKPGMKNGQPVKVWMTIGFLYLPPNNK